jgi:hypothetical protein
MDDQTIVVSDALEASGEAEDERPGDAVSPPDPD